MIPPGVYPAAITPLDAQMKLDMVGVAKLLAHFEAMGCTGAVIAGTNGEGPSLSAVEKRDLLRDSGPLKGNLDLILGVATPSLDEAIWMCKRAAEFGASAVLMMPPNYFRAVTDTAIIDWFFWVLDKSPVPIIVYNFPKMTGITITPEMMAQLGQHPNMAGCKDSSREVSNLAGYRDALIRREQRLFVGNETLLLDALKLGWSGTISGAANVMPRWLSQIVKEWHAGQTESAETKFELAKPVLEAIRSQSQPATHKAILHAAGVLPDPTLRLPLTSSGSDSAELVRSALMQAFGCCPA